MKDAESAVLLTGYTSSKVEYYDPKLGQMRTVSLEIATDNNFITDLLFKFRKNPSGTQNI